MTVARRDRLETMGKRNNDAPKPPKVCFIASSGGHLEQLKMLRPLMDRYDSFVVTERTKFSAIEAKYHLIQSGSRDPWVWIKLVGNLFLSLGILLRERPRYIVTTGTLIVLPMALLGKLLGVKLIYIESFAKLHDGTRTGLFLYRYADLFLVQWESMLQVYPKAVYGGAIY